MVPPFRLCALVAIALTCGCDGDAASSRAAPEATLELAASRAEAFPGQRAYLEAKKFIQRGDLNTAVTILQRAVAQNPVFTEAYYQLGAAKTNLAIEQVRHDERAAIDLFREGVEAKKTARRLMMENQYFIWNERQRAQARVDLREALRDIDAVLADEASLIAALRIYGG